MTTNSFIQRLQMRLALFCLVPLAALSAATASLAADPPTPKPPSKFKPFAEVTKDAKKYEGLFDLYQKDEHLYAAIKPGQMDQPFLAPMAIARGLASAGTPLNFGDEWVIEFHRAGDRVHVIRKNIHYEAPKGSPLERAVEQNYLDSIVMAIPVVSENPPGGGVLVDFSDIFFTDFANLRLGGLDRSRTTWHQVKAFPNNVELQVKATFATGMAARYADDGVVDPRGVTVVLHYSLTKRPDPGYRPRYADQRVGYFISATKDFGSPDPDTEFRRRINRWRLEKANPESKLSPPKQQIVWWVESTVPHAYRPFVEEGILEWNKAFEKIGFRNALDVRWQGESDEFDPEDTRYCTFRWITTPSTYAMSGLRADPISGEMIDGDVVFDASFIRYWKQEYALLVGQPVPTGGMAAGPLDAGEIISPMLAARRGFGLPVAPPQEQMRARMQHFHAGHDHGGHAAVPQLVPSTWSPLQVMLNRRLAEGRLCTCQYSQANRHEYRLAALALAAASEDKESGDKKEDGKEGDKKEDDKAPAELPEEFIGQTIKHIVMHEVGHSLGLRHNFKASTMLDLEDVNDKSITQEKGLTGSVMDYTPLNISADREKQGDFATTTIGPYDYWAIEYAYKPISGNEEEELKKIAARSPQADLAYATDEDLWMSNDPQVNAYDLGSDPLAYGKDRMALAKELMKDLDKKVVKDGQSWARLRSAYSALLSQYGNAAYLAASYIAGQSFSRDFKSSDEKSRDPVSPIAGKRQREALEFLAKEVLSDSAFEFSPKLLRRLTMEHWYHWGSDSMSFGGGVDFPIYDYVLSIQRIPLDHCLDAAVLGRLQNQQLLRDGDEEPLKMAEVFRTLSDEIWSELAMDAEETKEDGEQKLELSIIRRNLQREHLRKLSTIVIGSPRNPLYDLYNYVVFYGSSFNYPADARSLARMHLKELSGKIGKVLGEEELKMDDTTRAHLQEAQVLITKTLEAQFDAAGP
jgi:hypothetical protein